MAISRSIVESSPAYSFAVPTKNSLQTRQHYREGLVQAAIVYGVSLGRGRLDGALDSAVDIMLQLELVAGFTAIPERSLMALAIGESANTFTSDEEVKSLGDCLKLTATGYRVDGTYGTFSRAVAKWSKKGLPEGTLFDPKALVSNGARMVNGMLSSAREDIDDDASQATHESFSKWGLGSRLHVVRSILGIKPATEKPINVWVLKTSRDNLYKKFSFPSVNLRGERNTIILGNDFEVGDDEHEYVHSQARFPYHLLGNGVLFRGFIEAVTELAVTTPKMYRAQREAVVAIGEMIPDFDPKTIGFLMDRKGGRDNFFRMIIRERGLNGLVKISRMSPFKDSDPPPPDVLQIPSSRVLISPTEVVR